MDYLDLQIEVQYYWLQGYSKEEAWEKVEQLGCFTRKQFAKAWRSQLAFGIMMKNQDK